jgi:hypothetical protein
MKQRACAVVSLAVLASLWGCVPMTFSREAALDFDTYRHAAVQVSMHGLAAAYDDASATVYLVSELQAGSGFETVSPGTNDAADLTLQVDVSVTQLVSSDGDQIEYEFASDVRFTAVDRAGNLVDSGETFDSNEFATEAVQDALDEVALHYLNPYRL